MYIIAGLGNPGRKYTHTRHNAGFDVIDRLAEKYHIKIVKKNFQAYCGRGDIQGQEVLLMKPRTFMNRSGESILEAVQYHKIEASAQLVVIFDDISLEPGRIRVRKKGSAGGHNGIKDIISHIGTQEFTRVKIGVGEKPEGSDLAEHVLGRMPKEEYKLVQAASQDAVAAVELILQGKTDQAMNDYNERKRERG